MAKLKTNEFFQKTYYWMFIGLLISAITSLLVVNSGALLAIVFSPLLFLFIILELVFVVILSARVTKIKTSTAKTLFIVYSILNGLTLSVVFLAYTSTSIVSTFFIAAAMFGTMALIGYTTKKDLSSMGKVLFMALIGLIIAMITNLFLRNDTTSLIISIFGVIIFAGLIMYDNQWLKKVATTIPNGKTSNFAILGALKLYLDFVNIFLFLLRILGRRK